MRSTTKRPDVGKTAIAAAAVGLATLLALTMTQSRAGDTTVPEPVAPPVPAAPAPSTPQIQAAPPPSAEALRLHGLLGRGAVISAVGGPQRFVAIGRDAAPGLRVARIEQLHVVLASNGGEVRLGFDGPSPAASATVTPTGGASGSPEDRLRDETLTYRLGLAPPPSGSRTGFVVRPGIPMPALQRAGLRPGDTILSINGSGFDEERMLELAWELANTPRIEFVAERNGRRILLTSEPGS